MPQSDSVRRLLTIVVCSSPVPSNPDTATIRAIFASFALVRGLPRCPKLVHFDGPQAALSHQRVQAYNEFKRRVTVLTAAHPDFEHTVVFSSISFLFSAHNLAAAVLHVNTTFMLVMQHDYQLVRPFDVLGLLRTMHNSSIVKHVRLNARANIVKGFDGVLENFTAPGVLVPLTKTCAWSDAPHITSVRYYTNFVIPKNRADHNQGRRKFMEESVHYPMQRNGMKGGCWELKQMVKHGRTRVWPADFADYGTFLYGVDSPHDGSYTQHRSLRGNVPQWGLNAPGHKHFRRKLIGSPNAERAPPLTQATATRFDGGGRERNGKLRLSATIKNVARRWSI